MAEEKKSGAGKVVLAVVILVIILAVGALTFVWIKYTPGSISRKKAIENYYKAISTEDSELYKDTCFTQKWQDNYSSANENSGIIATINDSFTYQSGASYGNVEITVMEKLDKEYAEKMTEEIKSFYGIDVKVSTISKVNFSVETSFEGHKDSSGTITRYCYKSEGKWYFLADPDVLIALDLEG